MRGMGQGAEGHGARGCLSLSSRSPLRDMVPSIPLLAQCTSPGLTSLIYYDTWGLPLGPQAPTGKGSGSQDLLQLRSPLIPF